MVRAPQSEAREYRNQCQCRQVVKLTRLRANSMRVAGLGHSVWWVSATESTACDCVDPAYAPQCRRRANLARSLDPVANRLHQWVSGASLYNAVLHRRRSLSLQPPLRHHSPRPPQSPEIEAPAGAASGLEITLVENEHHRGSAQLLPTTISAETGCLRVRINRDRTGGSTSSQPNDQRNPKQAKPC